MSEVAKRSWPTRVAGTAQVVALTQFERRLPWWPMERIERLQRRRVRWIVSHAYEAVPFYREEMRARGLRPADFKGVEDLTRLPLIDAAMVRADPERFNSEQIPERDRIATFTSGSESKEIGTIFKEHRSLTRSLAVAERDRAVLLRLAGERRVPSLVRELIGRGAQGTRLAALGDRDGTHQRISIFPSDINTRTVRVKWSERTLIPAHTAHHHFLHPMTPVDEAVEHFNEIRPRVVYSFGSYADQFMRYLADRQPEVALPRLWVHGGDMLSGHGRELATGFGVRMWSVYSCTEAGRVGFQCDHGTGHHLNIDSCAFRVADDDGRTVPHGEPGDVVIAPLRNRATVLLNYRLGDRAVMSPDPCPCGRTLPLLARLEGRRSEVVKLADGRVVSSFVLQGIFGKQLKEAIQSQLRQPEPGRLRWLVVPLPGVDRTALSAAFDERAREMLGGTALDIEYTDSIERTERGKFRNVVA